MSKHESIFMLGIKHIKNSVFDVWQGDCKDFFCDKLLIISVDDFEKKTEDFFTATKSRHFAISFVDTNILINNFPLLWQQCLALVDGPIKNKRISFLVDKRSDYDFICKTISEYR